MRLAKWQRKRIKAEQFGNWLASDANGVVFARPIGASGQAFGEWGEVDLFQMDDDFRQYIEEQRKVGTL